MESLIEENPPTPRDPHGTAALYAKKLSDFDVTKSLTEQELQSEITARDRAVSLTTFTKYSIEYVVDSYAAGIALDTVLLRAQAALDAVDEAIVARAGVNDLRPYEPFDLDLYSNGAKAFGFLAFTACLSPNLELIKRFLSHLAGEPTEGVQIEALFELLAHAIEPNHEKRAASPARKEIWAWENEVTLPVLVALSQPADRRPAALAAHMKRWPSIMRGYGLKTKPRESYDLFPYFAFDVALAVCAFDIDDSSFRDHPHYPADLVAHYRSAIRNTRDAARPIGIDPGLPPMEIQRPPKADLAKSKRKGIARWVELVCDGDSQAVDAVLDKIGKPRKLGDIWDLMCALSEDVNHAVHGDIKDDATVAGQAEVLARDGEVGEFVPPETPPEGPARVTATLLAFDAWLAARGHRLVALENDDDAVYAVVVKGAYFDELMALSAALGIRARPAAVAYDES